MPHAWQDLVLGLPAGFLGALVLFIVVGVISDLVSPPPETPAKLHFEWWVSTALSAAACIFFTRRAPIFGIASTTGALLVVLIASVFAWLDLP